MGIFSKPKTTSAAEIAAKQRAAAEKERQKIALEQAQTESIQERDLQASYAKEQSRRQSLVGGVVEDDETSRRKFLKGV